MKAAAKKVNGNGRAHQCRELPRFQALNTAILGVAREVQALVATVDKQGTETRTELGRLCESVNKMAQALGAPGDGSRVATVQA